MTALRMDDMDTPTSQTSMDRRRLSMEASVNMLRGLIALFSFDGSNSPGPARLGQRQINELLDSLLNLTEEQIVSLGHRDSPCPICLVPFRALLAEEEMAHAMDSPAHPIDDLGVTRLEATCGHLFCRKDISMWIREGNDSCPLCRQALAMSSAPESPEAYEVVQEFEARITELLNPTGREGDHDEHAGMYA